MDVGGGLGVDYDGSQTNFESSMNYTLQEYANDVVYHIQTVCDEAGVEHPTIISESGRAVSAYHSMLIFNVLGTTGFGEEKIPTTVKDEFEQPLVDLIETYHSVTQRNALEAYHDAQQALDMAMNLFSGGYLPLEQRAHAENLFWAICEKIHKLTQGMDEVPGGSAVARGDAVGHLLLQLLAVPVDSRQLGDQAALPGDADSPARRAPGQSRRHRRHHLRLGRQARAVHRSPRRQEDDPAAPLQRRAVLPGRVPRRRLSGDPRRHAQPARRHARRARLAAPTTAKKAKARASSTSSRATPSPKCCATSSSIRKC